MNDFKKDLMDTVFMIKEDIEDISEMLAHILEGLKDE